VEEEDETYEERKKRGGRLGARVRG